MKEITVVALIAAIALAVLLFTWHLSSECSSRGGVLVRGFVWPACVARM